MNNDKKPTEKKKRSSPKAPVRIIVRREFVGTQTLEEAFIPVICEDIRKRLEEADTFDNGGDAA